MVKAIRIQEKARGVGFDWDDKAQVWEKVEEELNELKVEVENGNEQSTQEEFGDLLFSIINFARFVSVNPEDALEKTNKKFIKRFQYMEAQMAKKGLDISKLTLTEMDHYWNEAKSI